MSIETSGAIEAECWTAPAPEAIRRLDPSAPACRARARRGDPGPEPLGNGVRREAGSRIICPQTPL